MAVVNFPPLRGAPVEGGGQPPYDGDMEARLGRLEQFVGEARERLARVEATLGHVDREVSQTKWWVAGSAVAILLTMVGTVIGTSIGIQQMTVSTFQAAAQQQAPVAAPALAPVPAASTAKR